MSAKYSPSKRQPVLPPTILLIALIVMLGLNFIYPAARLIPAPWNLSGLLFLGTGIWISYAAEAQFRRLETAVNPYKKPTTLVVDGFYKFSRHPMYLGFASVLLGVAILLGSLSPLVVIPAFIVLVDRKFIRFEERLLEKTFGAAWLDYAQKVRRWI
jgi:protein-S-isoprenylcysteine O-methyltransferase Ste14